MSDHPPAIADVLVLGAGYAGSAVLMRARELGLAARGVVRRAEAAEDAARRGLDVVHVAELGPAIASLAGPRTHVVAAFPPDEETDARVIAGFAAREPRAAAFTYLSSTVVYGDHHGTVDDTTPVSSHPTEAAARRLAAEALWRGLGATILRCPAIYGPDRGLHVRVLRGKHRIPGDGRGFVSRIHVEDLAELVLAAPRAAGETFVVGDDEPAPHGEVVAWIASTYGVPMPPSMPIDDVHETLRGDRRVDARRAWALLGVTPRHPTYRVGMLGATLTRRG